MRKIIIVFIVVSLVTLSIASGQNAKSGGAKPIQGSKPSTAKAPVKKPQPAIVKTITIGEQTWAASNLNAGKFRNGDTIHHAKTAEQWKQAGANKIPAWCFYNNDPANGPKYGRIYNWYAVSDIRGLAPEGFEIPSEADWEQLKEYIGGVFMGGKLKAAGLTQWKKENKGGTNESGFGAVPSGTRYHFGDFTGIGEACSFWSSTKLIGMKNAYYCNFSGNTGNYGFGYTSLENGFSVRVIKKRVKIAQIGTQYWSAHNITEVYFRNGDPIMQAKTPTEWLIAGMRQIPAFMIGEVNTGYEARMTVYYNWYAVNDARKLVPEGFHIPTDAEWQALFWELGGEENAGGPLKTGKFAADKAGIKFESGTSDMLGTGAQWWSATELDSASASAVFAPFYLGNIVVVMKYPKGIGMPVRCLADSSISKSGPEYGEVKDIYNIYKTVKLGKQTWMAENLWAYKFNDGTAIEFTAASLGRRETPAYTDYKRFNKYYQDELRPYGCYYNGFVALAGNPCPLGWHLPTKADIEELIAFLGTNNTARNLKAKEKTYWEFGAGNNHFGFNARGSGYFSPEDFHQGKRNDATWWSSTAKNENEVWTMSLGINGISLSSSSKHYGYPCRCIKD